MESTISPIEAKEHLKSKKFGELVRIEFSNKGKIQNEKNDENIFFASSIHDIEDAMWLLDDTPQVVFATSGKINSEVDDFATGSATAGVGYSTSSSTAPVGSTYTTS